MNYQHTNNSKTAYHLPEIKVSPPANTKYSTLKSNSSTKPKPNEQDFQIKYKTEMCKNWDSGRCEFGDKCVFAHGDVELRNKSQTSSKAQIKGCKDFQERGYCILGSKCLFSHRDKSPETAPSSPEGSVSSSRKNSNETIRRLPIFIDLEARWC